MKFRIFPAASCLCLFAAAWLSYAGALTKADEQFLVMAARADMTEAHEGHMAEVQASRSDVKAFGTTLVRDHRADYERLTILAAKAGVAIPKGINVAKNRAIAQLVHLKGAGFDSEFAKDEVAAHRHTLAIYRNEAAHGVDTDVKDYATKMLPVLEKHLHLAEDCTKPTRRG